MSIESAEKNQFLKKSIYEIAKGEEMDSFRAWLRGEENMGEREIKDQGNGARFLNRKPSIISSMDDPQEKNTNPAEPRNIFAERAGKSKDQGKEDLSASEKRKRDYEEQVREARQVEMDEPTGSAGIPDQLISARRTDAVVKNRIVDTSGVKGGFSQEQPTASVAAGAMPSPVDYGVISRPFPGTSEREVPTSPGVKPEPATRPHVELEKVRTVSPDAPVDYHKRGLLKTIGAGIGALVGVPLVAGAVTLGARELDKSNVYPQQGELNPFNSDNSGSGLLSRWGERIAQWRTRGSQPPVSEKDTPQAPANNEDNPDNRKPTVLPNTPKPPVGGGEEVNPDSLTDLAPPENNEPEIQTWERPEMPTNPTDGTTNLPFMGGIEIAPQISFPVTSRVMSSVSMQTDRINPELVGIEGQNPDATVDKFLPNTEFFTNQEVAERMSMITMLGHYGGWRRDNWEEREDVTFEEYVQKLATGEDMSYTIPAFRLINSNEILNGDMNFRGREVKDTKVSPTNIVDYVFIGGQNSPIPGKNGIIFGVGEDVTRIFYWVDPRFQYDANTFSNRVGDAAAMLGMSDEVQRGEENANFQQPFVYKIDKYSGADRDKRNDGSAKRTGILKPIQKP